MRFRYKETVDYTDYSRMGIKVLDTDNTECYYIGEDWSLHMAHIYTGWSNHPLDNAFSSHNRFLICKIKSSTSLYIAKLVSSLVLL